MMAFLWYIYTTKTPYNGSVIVYSSVWINFLMKLCPMTHIYIEFCKLVLSPLPVGRNLAPQSYKMPGYLPPKVVRYTDISLIYHFGEFQAIGILNNCPTELFRWKKGFLRFKTGNSGCQNSANFPVCHSFGTLED